MIAFSKITTMLIPTKNTSEVIAVDFDGTLYNRLEDDTYTQAAESLKWYRRWGYKVIVYSGRASNESNIAWMKTWLKDHQIIFDEVTNIKPASVCWLIDDRGINFSDNWLEITEEIKKETFPWKK